jgi:hypothetical protein
MMDRQACMSEQVPGESSPRPGGVRTEALQNPSDLHSDRTQPQRTEYGVRTQQH